MKLNSTLTDRDSARDGAAADQTEPTTGGCRLCGERLRHSLIDLGMSPLCESWLTREDLSGMEPFYPLHALVCHRCFLVQTPAFVSGEQIFGGDYAYFSSYSKTWLAHARRYVEQMSARWGLSERSQVVEVASNDGYLLQYFVAKGVPALGIEPARNCAAAARERGVPTECRFFGAEFARELRERGVRADLLLGNNVLAHVPDLHDFIRGVKLLLADEGVNTMEFPHLVRLMEGNQFDTIYQEHYSYFSLLTIEQAFRTHGLTIFDVEELPTHGGSLRIFARHAEDRSKPVSEAVDRLRQRELDGGYGDLATYQAFADRALETRHALVNFLMQARRESRQVVGYGAPGKAVTLLNYCAVRSDLIAYTVDRNPYKQGRFMPGVRIPVHPIEKIAETRPDYVVILPWNLSEEIMEQLAYIRAWGGKFVIPIPSVVVIA